ncbi:type I polyketide synthase [Dictyobacter kobayashii]|uniref:Ketosynthase family 3 (KS3) domain-containing protein n=1 Tax=Dictyobacter kobayashii TaxID=2014872 RepID=A0A402AVP9_9CHLR|nr:type I polyketide synthase [Dictyobacter kobayashii]GCE23093.1 hypothetical protein KDK_68930 [Dictyobacter kobayashii]
MNTYEQNDERDELHIAIIGMAGRFPGAQNIEEFWHIIQDGVNAITFFSEQELMEAGLDPALLRNPQYVKARGVLDDVAGFDASFFQCTPMEAEIMDPQQRLFLESAWGALEDAGYNPETYPGLIGVFAGTSINTYLLNNLISNDGIIKRVGYGQLIVNNDKDHLATRTAYKLNLRGASLSIQTACSTSLVAIHLACQSLLQGECDMVLAGGASITVPHQAGYLYQDGGTNSPDGYCRAFDEKAQGMVKGNGVGVVVLKRYTEAVRDGDHIYAIIRGTAMNNDGSAKVGYTAPGIDGQARAIRHAQMMAEVEPESISYIEAHGTGTLLGDPIEVAALTQAFRDSTEAQGFCGIGSVKTNVGHLDAAAGVTGLIKTALMLEHKVLPPSLHYERPNPQIDFAASPFYVQAQKQDWPTVPGNPRRAGVSSFGIGGTNAHAILEEAPEQISVPSSNLSWQLFTLSARSEQALRQMQGQLAAYLQAHPELPCADIAYTLQLGRKEFECRQAILCRDVREAIAALQGQQGPKIADSSKENVPGNRRQIAFAFPGQGAQYVQMGRELYTELTTFRREVDTCAEILRPLLGFDLRTILYPDQAEAELATERLKQTAVTQPALFVIEYAFAKQWLEWNIQPQAMIGHSIGEYVAACLAGVFSLQDALKLVALRGQLMQTLPPGDMLAVSLSESEVQPYLGSELSLATTNAPKRCVISGTTAAIARLEQTLVASLVQCRRLHTSHAFHSSMMEPILQTFTEQIKQVTVHAPRLPYISNVTGLYVTEKDVKDPGYWARHLRQTVRFTEGLQTLLSADEWIVLEVGPGQTLQSFVKLQGNIQAAQPLTFSSSRHPKDDTADLAYLLQTLGQLWSHGVTVDWEQFQRSQTGQKRRVSLPTYPFEHKRYWIDPPLAPATKALGNRATPKSYRYRKKMESRRKNL